MARVFMSYTLVDRTTSVRLDNLVRTDRLMVQPGASHIRVAIWFIAIAISNDPTTTEKTIDRLSSSQCSRESIGAFLGATSSF